MFRTSISPKASQTNLNNPVVIGDQEPESSVTSTNSRQSFRVSSPGAHHPAAKASSLWACLGLDSDFEDNVMNATELNDPHEVGDSSDADDASYVSDAEDVSYVSDAKSVSDATKQAGSIPVLKSEEIAELKAAIEAESTFWSSKYAPDNDKHDPEFKALIDAYVHQLKLFKTDIENGALSKDQILERGNKLGTLWLRAAGLADANGWTETTRLCMKDAGEAYAVPSVKANEWNMGAGVVRGALLAGASITSTVVGAGPLIPLYIASGINFAYVGVQLGFSVMLPLQNAAGQSDAVKRQAQWGPLFNSSLVSSKCVKPAGGEHKLRTLTKVQAEFDEVTRLKGLYGQTTCDPEDVRKSRQKAEHRRDKYLERIDKRVDLLKKRLTKASERGEDIGEAGQKVLAATDSLVALAAAQGLKGTPYAPSAKWYERTGKSRSQHDLYALVTAQLDHVLDNAILDRATSISDEGVAVINPTTLAQLLPAPPAAVSARLAELTWELATTESYEALNVLTNQGHSRAARNALNLLAALFSLIGNAEDLSTVQQDTQELLGEIGKATAQVAQETANSFLGEVIQQVLGPLSAGLTTLNDLVTMPNESKWEILSWLTLLAQPRLYAYTQGKATALDMENKLATQAQIASMTNHGQILKDGKVNPAGLDAAMKGSMKVRMDHFKATLEFDSKVYQNAMWALLADKDHVTTANAVTVEVADPRDPGKTLAVSCTYMGLNAALDKFKKPEEHAERAALINALGVARNLNAADTNSLTTILALYEQNLVNITHVGKTNLQALLGPDSTLPEKSRLMLGSALRYAQAPKHLPPDDKRYAGVQAYLQSGLGKLDAEQDDLLAEAFGRTERRNNTGNVNQSAQKTGQSYLWFIAGSGGPTTIKAITTGVSEALKVAGGYVDPGLNTAALGVKVAGNIISIAGSAMGLFLGYAFHKFILQKNLDRQRDVDLKVPSVANSSVLSIENRDYMTMMSLDRMRGEVTSYETLLATPIPASNLPTPLFEFKQFVLQLLPEFLGQAAPAPGAPTLPPLPAMRYESKTSFVQDIWVQMRAAPLEDMFQYMSTPHGKLAQISPKEIETIIKEAAAAMFDEIRKREDEEGASGDENVDRDEEWSENLKIDDESFLPINQQQRIDPADAIQLAQEYGLWHDQAMQPEEREARVAELVEFASRSEDDRSKAIDTLLRVQSNFAGVLAGGNPGLDEGMVQAIQQSHDLISGVLRQLG